MRGRRTIFQRINSYVEAKAWDRVQALVNQAAERESALNARLFCTECGAPDSDDYMVTAETWAAAGMAEGRSGFLHVECLEKRVGRPLRISDFPDLPINKTIRFAFKRG